MEAINAPLNNAQVEILKLFTTNLSADELAELKKMLLEFKFKRVAEMAEKAWDEKGWTQDTMDELLKTHLRTPYRSQEAHGKKQKDKPGKA